MSLLPLLTLLACASVPPAGTTGTTASPTPSPIETPAAASPSASPYPVGAEPTTGIGEFLCSLPYGTEGTTDAAVLADLRVEGHAGFDRIVFQFTGDGPTSLPFMNLQLVNPPFVEEVSGRSLDVDGTSFLELTFQGTSRTTPSGAVVYSGRLDFAPDLPGIEQLRMRREADRSLRWIVGLPEPSCYRVAVLTEPGRIVLDLRHPET